ncbi:alpha/beta fold hydrolase [Marinobacter shengliensis]|uniref:alpha/beta fold hydrolase n=1 Tax=Marinobacter shengliensis TaxID=1389223 RepID=UPI0025748A0C|nr:alpha/beta hydrolase [Marinobacter shengliensis]BEH16457.1 sigma factor SigB regulation protein RsbQ [Marinobacter shengliensis]
MSALRRNKVTIRSRGEHTLVFAHGFGCDQMVWDDIVPAFENDYRVVTFDHVGCGRSDRRAYRAERHGTLRGYALDLLDVVDLVSDKPVTLVGHSVGGMIGFLAAIMLPDRFRHIIAIGPSPRYTNDGEHYVGGLDKQDVLAMLERIETDPEGWASDLAPLVMENSHRPELTERLIRSFLATDPVLLRKFADATFLCDYRRELAKVQVPVDILYTLSDAVVPTSVVSYMAKRLPDVHCTSLQAQGHYPQLSAPAELVETIAQVMRRRFGA